MSEQKIVPVGDVGIQCPACDEVIPVQVVATIGNPDLAHYGLARLILDSDMTDLWAHGEMHAQASRETP